MTKRVLLPAIAAIAASFAASNVAWGAETSMQLHFAGAERVTQNAKGGVDVIKGDGSIEHFRPEVYQIVNGKRKAVLPAFHIVSKDRVELELRNVDPAAEVVLANAPRS